MVRNLIVNGILQVIFARDLGTRTSMKMESAQMRPAVHVEVEQMLVEQDRPLPVLIHRQCQALHALLLQGQAQLVKTVQEIGTILVCIIDVLLLLATSLVKLIQLTLIFVSKNP